MSIAALLLNSIKKYIETSLMSINNWMNKFSLKISIPLLNVTYDQSLWIHSSVSSTKQLPLKVIPKIKAWSSLLLILIKILTRINNLILGIASILFMQKFKFFGPPGFSFNKLSFGIRPIAWVQEPVG